MPPVHLLIVDTTSPGLEGCPNNIQTTTELGTLTKSITWSEPTAIDLSGTPTRTRSDQPGDEFPLGVTSVRYNFTDGSSNTATCTFSIILETGNSCILFTNTDGWYIIG